MNLKKTAICILSYNTESYISKVLKELVDLERPLLIIDDCSTDSSYSMIDSLLKITHLMKYYYLKIKRTKGQGTLAES